MPLPDDRREPSVPPTRPSTLAVAALATTALAWLAVGRYYSSMPKLPVLPAVTLLALALLEFFAAANTKARIERRRGTEPVDPLLVARFVVLAKASALAGALFGGVYLGLSIWLLTERGHLVAAGDDLPPALIGLVGSIALVTAAWLLERACRVPPSKDEDEAAAGTEDAGG